MKVALIGLGASGLFCLYGLQKSKHEIHVFDVGVDFSKRIVCPIDSGKISKCPPVPCWPACIPATSGGIFNDYKVITSASPVIGGRLFSLLGQEELQLRLDKVKSLILNASPKPIPEVHPDQQDLDWINSRTVKAGMTYHYQSLIHCGTDNAVEINGNILESIDKSNMKFNWRRKVTSIVRQEGKFVIISEVYRPRKYEALGIREEIFDAIIISVGRGGTKWLSQQEFYQDLQPEPGQVDIGVRVETSKVFTEELDRRFYEPKLYYQTSRHNDTVRNFCSNPGGFVTPENHEEYVLVNGYSKSSEKSENNNFAVLVSKTFTRPFKNPQLYSQHIAKVTNMLAGAGPLVQRLGDLKAGRRTKTLENNMIKPTLEAMPGDISLAYPHRVLEGILEYMEALNKVCDGVSSNHTLLYAPEIKSFPDRIPLTKNMLTKIHNLYIIGDASSWTRSVAHSAVSGILCSEHLTSLYIG